MSLPAAPPLRLQVLDAPFAPHSPLTEALWDELLVHQCGGQTIAPFMRHAYLAALHHSGAATAATGWQVLALCLWAETPADGRPLRAACLLYVKSHSYGEYVFDWAWANAYARHGLAYYPKGVVAVPFTPVPGPRLLAREPHERVQLVQALVALAGQLGLSSLHLLFGAPADQQACAQAGLLARQTVQFHWENGTRAAGPTEVAADALAADYASFDDFLAQLSQDKRKKIRQERRKVAEAGVSFRVLHGREIRSADWDFFYRCYERTYWEHGNAPYLNRAFFAQMARHLAPHWVMFIAERGGQPIASSLIAIDQAMTGPAPDYSPTLMAATAYGRYWGALERVDCLHFEACYYQPLDWCIRQRLRRFEGGAQGEHKMARALLPVSTHSAHWLAHPGFADAVGDFLERERDGIGQYLDALKAHSPLRQAAPDA